MGEDSDLREGAKRIGFVARASTAGFVEFGDYKDNSTIVDTRGV